jgi:kynurenine formamidase
VTDTRASIDTVRELSGRYSNWGRWGPDDELGTLNFVTPQHVQTAASLIQIGRPISLQIPLDEHGPQRGGGRFNPIHLMRHDGNDADSDLFRQQRWGDRDPYFRGADDIIIFPLQCSTQWDALSHVFFEGKMYNGFSAEYVNSGGAYKNDVAVAKQRTLGRGVLLDMPRLKQVPYLEPGYPISSADLDQACAAVGIKVNRGDFLLVRTGQITQARERGDWGDYAGGNAPGLGLDSIGWLYDHEVAGVATDTWGMEVRPNETPDVFQPLHIICIVHMGLWVGEIWDLDPLAEACAELGRYEFFLSAQPLVVSRAVGSCLNPVAIL